MSTSSKSRAQPGGARRFDALAEGFDRRTGLDPAAVAGIAAGVLELVGPFAGGHCAMEIGAGTGEIGQELARRAERYVGIDVSAPMLDMFRSKVQGGAERRRAPLLVQADADGDWPVRGASVTVVFASRVAHLLEVEHVVAETRRVCRSGGCFVVGRIERTGVKQVLRQQREAIAARRGLGPGRSGTRRSSRLLDAFVAAGAEPVPARTAATWTATTSARRVISGWEAMPTIGGQEVDPFTRAAVLDELRDWARAHLGDLDRPEPFSEDYTLEGARLP